MTEITEEFYKDWADTFHKASTSIQNREEKLEQVAELIEKVGLFLIDERKYLMTCFVLIFGY